MFALADVAFHIVTLAMIGPEPLTVTTSATMWKATSGGRSPRRGS